MIYITSDTHFNHANIIEYCKRPFVSLEDMNAKLIMNWNARVLPTDEVYHLGDVCMGKKEFHHGFINQLNGKKYLVKGNHDRSDEFMKSIGFLEVVKELTITDPKYGVIYMAHIPIKEFTGDYMLCGHIHSQWRRYGNIINVGVDVRDFEPKTIEELLSEPAPAQNPSLLVDDGQRSR